MHFEVYLTLPWAWPLTFSFQNLTRSSLSWRPLVVKGWSNSVNKSQDIFITMFVWDSRMDAWMFLKHNAFGHYIGKGIKIWLMPFSRTGQNTNRVYSTASVTPVSARRQKAKNCGSAMQFLWGQIRYSTITAKVRMCHLACMPTVNMLTLVCLQTDTERFVEMHLPTANVMYQHNTSSTITRKIL